MSGNGNSDPPEPFATLLALVEKFGYLEVVKCLAEIAQLRSEDEEGHSVQCRALSARWGLELEQLGIRMSDFLEPEDEQEEEGNALG